MAPRRLAGRHHHRIHSGWTIIVSTPVVDKAGVHGVDQENKVARAIALNRVDTEVFPQVNNYDPIKQSFYPGIVDFFANPQARASFLQQVDLFLAANPSYRGLSLDFEGFPATAQPDYQALVADLYTHLHTKKSSSLHQHPRC